MSFLFGQTKTISGTPPDVQGLRRGFAGFLEGQLPQLGSTEPSPFFVEQFLNPIRTQFEQNRERAFAQAKESAGTLTGSGLANVLGRRAQESVAQEDVIMSELLRRHQAQILNAILGFSVSGVRPDQPFFQPGLLDHLFKGAGAAAPLLAGAVGGGGGAAAGGGTATGAGLGAGPFG